VLILDRAAVHDEMERARIEFRELLSKASPASLRPLAGPHRETHSGEGRVGVQLVH
jgi:hypothetical protein